MRGKAGYCATTFTHSVWADSTVFECAHCLKAAGEAGRYSEELLHLLTPLCVSVRETTTTRSQVCFHYFAVQVAKVCNEGKAEQVMGCLARIIENVAAPENGDRPSSPLGPVGDTIRLRMRLLAAGTRLFEAATTKPIPRVLCEVASRSNTFSKERAELERMSPEEILPFLLLLSASSDFAQMRSLHSLQLVLMQDDKEPHGVQRYSALAWWGVLLYCRRFTTPTQKPSITELTTVVADIASAFAAFRDSSDFKAWWPDTSRSVAAAYWLAYAYPYLQNSTDDKRVFRTRLNSLKNMRLQQTDDPPTSRIKRVFNSNNRDDLNNLRISHQYFYPALPPNSSVPLIPSTPEAADAVLDAVLESYLRYLSPTTPMATLRCKAKAAVPPRLQESAQLRPAPSFVPIASPACPLLPLVHVLEQCDEDEWETVSVKTAADRTTPPPLQQQPPPQQPRHQLAAPTPPTPISHERHADSMDVDVGECAVDAAASAMPYCDGPEYEEEEESEDDSEYTPRQPLALVSGPKHAPRGKGHGGELSVAGARRSRPKSVQTVVPYTDRLKVRVAAGPTIPLAGKGAHAKAEMCLSIAQAEISFNQDTGFFSVEAGEDVLKRFAKEFAEARDTRRLHDNLHNPQADAKVTLGFAQLCVTVGVSDFSGDCIFVFGDNVGNRSILPLHYSPLRVHVPYGCVVKKLLEDGSVVRPRRRAGEQGAVSLISLPDHAYGVVEDPGKEERRVLRVFVLAIPDGERTMRLFYLNMLSPKAQEKSSVAFIVKHTKSEIVADVEDINQSDGTQIRFAALIATHVRDYVRELHEFLVVRPSDGAQKTDTSFSAYAREVGSRRYRRPGQSACAPAKHCYDEEAEEDVDEEEEEEEEGGEYCNSSSSRGGTRGPTPIAVKSVLNDGARRGQKRPPPPKQGGKDHSKAPQKRARTTASAARQLTLPLDNFTAFGSEELQREAKKERLILPHMVTFAMSTNENVVHILAHAIATGVFGEDIVASIMQLLGKESEDIGVISAEVAAWLANGSCLVAKAFQILDNAASNTDPHTAACFQKLAGPISPRYHLSGARTRAGKNVAATETARLARGADLSLHAVLDSQLVKKTIEVYTKERAGRQSIVIGALSCNAPTGNRSDDLFAIEYTPDMIALAKQAQAAQDIATELARARNDLAQSRRAMADLETRQASACRDGDGLTRKMFTCAIGLVERNLLTTENLAAFKEVCVGAVRDQSPEKVDTFFNQLVKPVLLSRK